MVATSTNGQQAGRIVQVIGSTFDAEFEEGHLPEIYHALRIEAEYKGVPIKLTVFPGAYHAFDAPQLTTPLVLKGHHLEFNQAAADQSSEALRDFLDTTIGKAVQ